jgi:hypothetical protein
LLGAAIIAEDFGGQHYNSSNEWLQNKETCRGKSENTRERPIKLQWHTLKL